MQDAIDKQASLEVQISEEIKKYTDEPNKKSKTKTNKKIYRKKRKFSNISYFNKSY